jgi:hypothetical protein
MKVDWDDLIRRIPGLLEYVATLPAGLCPECGPDCTGRHPVHLCYSKDGGHLVQTCEACACTDRRGCQ